MKPRACTTCCFGNGSGPKCPPAAEESSVLAVLADYHGPPQCTLSISIGFKGLTFLLEGFRALGDRGLRFSIGPCNMGVSENTGP